MVFLVFVFMLVLVFVFLFAVVVGRLFLSLCSFPVRSIKHTKALAPPSILKHVCVLKFYMSYRLYCRSYTSELL